MTFAAIWSNPPIRIGKDALHELLLHWLGRLAADGAATLVVNRNLGSDSLAAWLTAQGFPTERLASRKGYRILRVTRGPRAQRRGGSTSIRRRCLAGRGVSVSARPRVVQSPARTRYRDGLGTPRSRSGSVASTRSDRRGTRRTRTRRGR